MLYWRWPAHFERASMCFFASFAMANDYMFLEVGGLDWEGARTTCILRWSIEEASQCGEAYVTTKILDTPSAQHGDIRFSSIRCLSSPGRKA